MSQLEKWVTVRKACHSWKCVTVRKLCHSLKKCQLSLKRWLTVRKMCHSYKNVNVKVMKPNSPLNNDFKLFLYVDLNLTRKIAQSKYIFSFQICSFFVAYPSLAIHIRPKFFWLQEWAQFRIMVLQEKSKQVKWLPISYTVPEKDVHL